MRALIYPNEGYVAENLQKYLQVFATVLCSVSGACRTCLLTLECLLQKCGHEVVTWQNQETGTEVGSCTALYSNC